MLKIARTARRALVLLAVLAAFGVPLAYAQEGTTAGTTTDGTSTDATTTDATTTAEEPPPPPPLVPDGVTIVGVAVGGLTAEQARRGRACGVLPALHPYVPQPQSASISEEDRRFGRHRGSGRGGPRCPARAGRRSRAAPQSADATRLRSPHRGLVVAAGSQLDGAPARSSAPHHEARLGYRIRRLAARVLIRRTFAARGRGPISLPYRVLRPSVRRGNFGPVVVVRRGSHRLYLYRGSRFWHTFGVAVGMPQYPTPLGRFYIAVKQRNPWWYPPNASWAAGASPIPPGPGNPLGTRWMGLSWSGIGIHGTPDSASIGYSASHGCISMGIPEAEWLFERVRIGTPVFIVYA
jgi:hypothetical protein